VKTDKKTAKRNAETASNEARKKNAKVRDRRFQIVFAEIPACKY
jgi:hypothetical protein